MLKKILLIQIILFCTVIGQPLKTEEFTVADGLSDSQINYILQDKYGLLWIATETGGVILYDGYTFKIFKNVPGNPQSLIHNSTQGLAEDENGNIWIATESGVSKYVRAKNHFVNYDFEEIFPEKSDLNIKTFLIVIDKGQNVWVSTNGLGVVRFNIENESWNIYKNQTSKGVFENDDDLAIACCIDLKGRLWSGRYSFGLNWFDENEQIFKPASIKNTEKIPDFTKPENLITYLYTDATGKIWITTRNGIYKYNPDTQKLKILLEYKTQKLNFYNHYNSIAQDNNGNIWVANNFRGILKFDGISDEFEEVRFANQNISKEGVSNMVLTRLCSDQSGIMWFGSIVQGLIKYDPHQAAFKHFIHNKKNPYSISGDQVFGLFESKKHKEKIYVGLRGSGLNLFDPKEETFEKIPLTLKNDLFGGSIRAINEGPERTLWLGAWGDGLLKMNENGLTTNQFQWDSSKTNSLPNNLVRVLERDAIGNYWVGTNDGLCYLDVQQNSLKRITNFINRVYPQELLNDINSRMKKTPGNLHLKEVGDSANVNLDFQIVKPRNYLVVSCGEGNSNSEDLFDYGWISDVNGKEIWSGKKYNANFHLGGGIKNRMKIDMLYLTPGNYSLNYKSDDSHSFKSWNADQPTYLDLWGIHLFEIKNEMEAKQIQYYLTEASQQMLINGENIRSIHVSNNGIIWVGSDQKGLNKLDPHKNTVKNYAADPEIENTVSDNSIQYIYEDEESILWLATNGGLNRFDPDTEKFSVYTEEDGLPTNYIASILPGNLGEFWLSTRNGLSKMITSPTTGKVTFVNYDTEDGLGGTDFIAQVALKSSTGRYYFGGDHGLNIFSPTDENESPPALYLSDLKIGNTSLQSNKSLIQIDTTLTDLTSLELSHDHNDLTFAYSALHFSKPQKNQYAYMLQGYDTEWNYGKNRTATYTNLDPGRYTFSFKGSNRDGIWNEKGKYIEVLIKPPWWQTIWAYFGYGLFFLGIIFGIDRIQRRRLMAQNKEKMRIREMEMRTETAELQAKAAEAERRALQAENERKSKELEEARNLQLSMLPKELPQLPHLDIAVYMETATEVGGDYYDFHVALDGTLTVVVGDATGHGMKAGTMVTTAKSLFNSYAPNPDILFSFKEITRCIKQMNFGKLSMCMTMLKIKGDKMQISTAGMPPSFIFRRDTRVVEEHLFKAMPLGTMEKFPYEIKDTTLNPGDTILLLSDGLPELKNDDEEMYGYKRIRNGFEDVAEKAPEEIVSYLKNEGAGWVNNADPDDDVTFVVIKVK